MYKKPDLSVLNKMYTKFLFGRDGKLYWLGLHV